MGQFENPFLFYLQDPDTSEFLYVDNAGVVQSQVAEIYLQHALYIPADPQAPEGWRDTEAKWARNPFYWGLYGNITTEFVFQGDAAKILRSLYLAQGSNAKCRLIIKEYDYANVGASVSLNVFYSGLLDFFKANPSYGKFAIPIKDEGLRDLFFQNESVVYEIPVTGDPDVVTAVMDGITLQGHAEFVGEGTGMPFTPGTSTIIPITFSLQDGNYKFGVDKTAYPSLTTNGPLGPDNWFFKSNRTQTVTVNVQCDITFHIFNPTPHPTVGIDAALSVYDTMAAGTLVTDVALFPTVGAGMTLAGTQPPIPVNATLGPVTVNADNTFYLHIFHDTPSLDMSTFDVANLVVTFDTEFQLPTSNVECLREVTVLERIADAMTGGLYAADTAFLSTITDIVHSKPYETVYASGDGIRGLPSVLKITPKDFFDNIMKSYGLGITIESNQVVPRPLAEILDASNLTIDLGEAKDLKAPIAEEYIYNSIEAGNNENDYDQLNGKDEFMNTSKFKTVLTNPQTLSLIRRFRYDTYGIENTRYELFNKDTTDSQADNQIFVWEIEPGTNRPRRSQNDPGCFATGINFPATMYNISKAPLLVMVHNLPLIQASLFFQPTDAIAFQSTEKNSALAYRLDAGGDEYAENGYINTFALKPDPTASPIPYAPLFIPILFRIKVNTPKNLFEELNTNPNGYVTFTYRGVQLKGFPMKIGMKYATLGEYECELLCHPDVSLADINTALGEEI